MQTPKLKEMLILAVESRLLKILFEEGFSKRNNVKSPKSRELCVAFPLSSFVRKVGDIEELVEVQFDKHGRLMFTINFGLIPPEGLKLPWGNFAPDEIDSVASLEESYRLMRNPRLQRWFGVPIFSFDKSRAILTSVNEATDTTPEMLKWFDSKVIGKHMQRIGYPHKSND
jgi:hypothetical protein